jgi:predicted DCC family thiol-disulfide oxidoreductase YuxK
MTSEPRELVLYHTAGCHLCDLAEQLLLPLAAGHGWRLSRVDIAADETLLERYGVRIPVVRDAARGIELGWPFTADELERSLR